MKLKLLLAHERSHIRRRDPAVQSGIPMARHDRPEKRIRRIPNFSVVSRGTTRWSIAAILAMAAPLVYLAAAADPQSAPQPAPSSKPPEFEVASIRPSPPLSDPRHIVVRIGTMPGGGLRVGNITLRELIAYAHKIDCEERRCRDFISGGPDWMDSSRYDIQARAPQPEENLDHLTVDQRRKHRDQLIRQRLQSLLADRFQLVLHSETKAGQTYALVVAKKGHKLRPGTGESSVKGGEDRLTAENTRMEGLARDLTILLGRPVTDKTGLAGATTSNSIGRRFRTTLERRALQAADLKWLTCRMLPSHLRRAPEPTGSETRNHKGSC